MFKAVSLLQMSEEIKNVKLSFACNEDWDGMTSAEGGRHCDKCNKKVYDFTNSKTDDFLKILAENNNRVCGRFNATQTASTPVVLPFWKRWLSAAMILAGVNFAGCKDNQKQTLIGDTVMLPPADTISQSASLTSGCADSTSNDIKGEVMIPVPAQPKPNIKSSPNEIFTSVEILPEFEGGPQGLQSFINKHLNTSKTTKPAKVNVAFIVEKDGSLTDVRTVGRNTDEAASAEAIRVIKMSPKWIPGKQNGKPVRVQYTIPVVFNKIN
jgi:TonB family protein